MKRVYIVGAFDFDNYGDLLFPLIAAYRLNNCGFDVIPVAPTAKQTAFLDAIPHIDVKTMLTGNDLVDGILIGGGWIIHNQPVENLAVYNSENVGKWASVGFWLSGVLAGAIRNVPIIWNAPGVPNPFPSSKLTGIVEPAVDASDYVAVRERISANLLVTQNVDRIHIVPDTAIDISNMWPKEHLQKIFYELALRESLDVKHDYAVIHLRRNLGSEDIRMVAGLLDEFMTAQGLTPLIVSISHIMNDSRMATEFAQHLRSPYKLLSNFTSLKEIAACIACSKIYLGTSLHGYVTASAYDIPGVIIANSAHRRFSGFQEHIGRPRDLARTWRDGLNTAQEHLAAGGIKIISNPVRTLLDEHWNRVESVLNNPLAGSDRRYQFLCDYLRYGILQEGVEWGLEPGITKVFRYRSNEKP